MIHARVQHHPSRVALLPRLLEHLTPFTPRVVEHASFPPDPWSGFRACIRDLPDCDHVLTIQDDAIPVDGFSDALVRISARHPDTPVCLWMSAIPSNAAGRARKAYGRSRYISLGPAPFVPLVAVLWPRNRLVEFGEWSTGQTRLTRADDGNVARWMRQTRQEFLVCVPSIVEHDDFVPSVKGGTRGESLGRARDRVALLLAEDARDYHW